MKIVHTEKDARGRVLFQRLDAAEIAPGADGAPAYIDIRVRLKGSDRCLGLELAQVWEKLKEPIDPNSLAMAELWEECRMAEYKVLAMRVAGWNWADDSGDPLPTPEGPAVFAELYEDQRLWIFDQIGELNRYTVTEGNAPSGGD